MQKSKYPLNESAKIKSKNESTKAKAKHVVNSSEPEGSDHDNENRDWATQTVVSSKEKYAKHKSAPQAKKIYSQPTVESSESSSESESSDSETEKAKQQSRKKDPSSWMTKRVNPYEFEAQMNYEKNTPLQQRTLLERDFEKLGLKFDKEKTNTSDEKDPDNRKNYPKQKPSSSSKNDKSEKKTRRESKVKFFDNNQVRNITGKTYCSAPEELIFDPKKGESSAYSQPSKDKKKQKEHFPESSDATKTYKPFDPTKTTRKR